MKNDLKHLRRSELIDLIYEMKKREIELQTRLDEAEEKLQAREITMVAMPLATSQKCQPIPTGQNDRPVSRGLIK